MSATIFVDTNVLVCVRDRTDEVREDIIALSAWRPVAIDVGTMERAWDLQDRFAFSWWDPLIVAAAVEARCRYLLTEDLQDGQIVDGLTIVSPFTRRPDELVAQA